LKEATAGALKVANQNARIKDDKYCVAGRDKVRSFGCFPQKEKREKGEEDGS